MDAAAPTPTVYCPRCLTSWVGGGERCPNLSCGRSQPEDGWGVIHAPGELFDRHYRIHRLLALGGAGLTYQGREVDAAGAETGGLLAIKVLFAERGHGPYLHRLATEAQILQELDHPGIVACRGFVHRAGRAPYLVTRFEAGGSLLDHIRRVGPLPVAVAADVGWQVCEALAAAHARGVIHRDLKPENVLLAAATPAGAVPEVRLADFGIAKVDSALTAGRTRAGAFVGTPEFAAPEQWAGAAPSPATDVYGVGALLTCCATGSAVVTFPEALPWEERLDWLLARLPPRLPLSGDEGAALEAVLARAMAIEPTARCSLPELSDLLRALALEGDDDTREAETGPGVTIEFPLPSPATPAPDAVPDAPRVPSHLTWSPGADPATRAPAAPARTIPSAHDAWTPPSPPADPPLPPPTPRLRATPPRGKPPVVELPAPPAPPSPAEAPPPAPPSAPAPAEPPAPQPASGPRVALMTLAVTAALLSAAMVAAGAAWWLLRGAG